MIVDLSLKLSTLRRITDNSFLGLHAPPNFVICGNKITGNSLKKKSNTIHKFTTTTAALCVFFTPTLACGLSLGFQCSGMAGLDYSSDFLFL